jgi:hypothetical protein
VLDGTRCTTGFCADLGTLGLCSAACDDTHPCPTGAACAHWSGGQQICLVACSAANSCTRDPSLECKVGAAADAGADAATGFRIVSGDSGASYCAPI